jgi:hypothetical protein
MTEVLNNLLGSKKTGSSGYHGGIVSDIPEIQLQKCADFKVDFNPNLFKQSSLMNDPSTARLDVHQSLGVGAYHLDNMYGCECGLKDAREIQISQPAINFDGGKGWMGENGCLIENDSALRFRELTKDKTINQLPNLQTPGFFGKGDYYVDTETVIQSANFTRVDRPCNILSGITIENLQPNMMPMNPRLLSEVQDTNHIIPEDSMTSWVRGGLPSRQIARNVDYINRCETLRNNEQ